MMLTITLINPQIPPNTGNIARLCAGVNIRLHLVGKLGFELTDKYLKRAGLDYWHLVDYSYFEDSTTYLKNLKEKSYYLFTTKSQKPYTRINFQRNDFLIFGSEITGLGEQILNEHKNRCYTIPTFNKELRSYNLSSAAAIVAFEALRQTMPDKF